MEHQFTDRVLTCSDCKREFVFTAGEQVFFHEKEFKNDPKRCKLCKSRRGAAADAADGEKPVQGLLLRTETRTECSECGVDTTVPFKPTQGRPVLCRQCFQRRGRAAAARVRPATTVAADDVAQAITAISEGDQGNGLTAKGATMAAAAMDSAAANSSVANVADLETLSAPELQICGPHDVPLELVAAEDEAEPVGAGVLAGSMPY